MKCTLPLLLFVLNACSADIPVPKPEIKARPEASSPPPAALPPPVPSVAPEPVIKADPTCLSLSPRVSWPHTIDQPSLMAIGFLKTCTLEDGSTGFVKGSSFTAMGFPCTKGRGRIDRKGGSESAPALVNFHMPTSCPMAPATGEEAERVLRQRLNIPTDSRLIAYYPLSIDYWEFLLTGERDTGFVPGVYSQSGLNLWQKLSTKSEAIRVRLYGRENAWDRGKVVYEVEADIVYESRSTFRLQVIRAQALSSEQKEAVRLRCDEIKPKRDCGEVFN